ncbi:MAG TPA: universal stress protein, partial [Anaerolineales bacterium]|nr:universal stress protein [Anaerolineales bacterium]
MQQRSEFSPIRTIIVPFVHDGPGLHALDAARLFDAEIILIGVVVVPDEESLSVGAASARALRKLLRIYGRDKRITSRSKVIVSHDPWKELSNLLQDEEPDLLCLEFDSHPKAFRVTVNNILERPPCDIALVRGKISSKPKQVLVPVRGGPHAELALRVGLGLYPKGVSALHIRRTGDPQAGTDAPFKGLAQVLAQMPEVQKQFEVTDDAAQVILKKAKKADVLILGTTIQPITSSASLGPVADQVLKEAPCAVIAVKSGRPQTHLIYDESAGYEAISILVDKWFAENTFHANEFNRLRDMLELKHKQGLTISLALPALNEEETVGRVIRMMKKELMHKVPLLDEIVLIDSDSTDRTREIAHKEGIPVHVHQHLLPDRGARRGKGEALWKSLLVTKGDLIIWIDTDIVNIHPRFVYGIL